MQRTNRSAGLPGHGDDPTGHAAVLGKVATQAPSLKRRHGVYGRAAHLVQVSDSKGPGSVASVAVHS